MIKIPDESDLISFFKSLPLEESNPKEGYCCYEVTDAAGIRLKFSFHLLEQSVQTTLYNGDWELIRVSQEVATEIEIKADVTLKAYFDQGYGKDYTELQLQLEPQI